jgi:hypothetical protein
MKKREAEMGGDSFQLSRRSVRMWLEIVGATSAFLTPVVAKLATNPSWVWLPAGISILLMVIAKGITHSLEQEHLGSPKDLAICGVLREFYLRAFDEESGHRVTLFQCVESKSEKSLIPTHRFSYGPGAEHVSRKRKFSCARFRVGSAIVGFAWEAPHKLFARSVPVTVKSSHDYDNWARQELRMSDEEIKNLSARCRRQRFFSAWAFVDEYGKTIGAILVDSERENPFEKGVPDSRLFEEVSRLVRFLLQP